jgi:DNA-binding NarL/FixJ family response regulator
MSGQPPLVGAYESGSVLVVDDDDCFRSFVAATLACVDLGLAIREAKSGEDALLQARLDTPSLVVLDVCLPGISGFELCRELREQLGGELPIILVSGTKVDSLDRSAGLLIGGDDFLVKPVDPNELLGRVRRLLGRSTPPRTRPASREYGLTKRELAVLQQLARGLRQIDIASELVISPKTVASHVQHIFTKLGVHSGAQAVTFGYDHGLLGIKTPPVRRSG